MNTHAALLELVIHARERGEIDDPRLLRACRALEERIARIRERERRRVPRHKCVRCERGTPGDLICMACRGEAPAGVRNAFRNAGGLDGMRAAARLVLAWARADAPAARSIEERRAA